jgi:hypothetical protein
MTQPERNRNRRSPLDKWRSATSDIPRPDAGSPVPDKFPTQETTPLPATPTPPTQAPTPPPSTIRPPTPNRQATQQKPTQEKRRAPRPAVEPLAPSPRALSHRNQGAAWLVGTLTITVLTCVAITAFSSAARPTTNWLFLLGSLALLALGAYVLVRYLRPTLVLMGATLLCFVLVLSLFAYGLTSSVIIRGKVYWAGSTTARVYALASQLQSDITTIQNDDVLLTYSVDTARTHFSSYGTAIKVVQDMYNHWGTYPHTGLPDPGFVDVINNLAAAAAADVGTGAGGGALPDKRTYVNSSFSDPTLATTIISERAGVISALQTAQIDLSAITSKYHFSLTPSVHE